jgi:alpha-galactosidase
MSFRASLVLAIAVLAAAATIGLGASGGATPGGTNAPGAPGGGGAGIGRRGGRSGVQQPPPASEGVVLPKSVPADGRPQINGPRVTGATPGRPFQYRIAATGDTPLTFSVDGLPDGLAVDSNSGLITGSLKAPLSKAVTIHVKNAKGEAARQFVIVGGVHKLALTPPLGWNSWNCYGDSVTDLRMRTAADGMEKSGLAAHGFEYVNLDDGWTIRPRGGAQTRAADGTILLDPKFPDLKALADYIHGKGLKFGVYSGPGPTTCQGREASINHEEQDARTWAAWGVDYIKYDLCSYDQIAGAAGNERSPEGMAAHKLPYQKLRTALDKLDRDIVYSLCQYNRTLQVSVWGSEEGINGNLWRVTGDISTGPNVWSSMTGIGFQQNGHEPGAAPGHWNDTDMLVVGSVGLANGGTPRPTYLTENEQLTHIGLWSMLAAPLLLGCDMNAMDEFTRNLMENDEILAVDQDPLGKQAWRIAALNADDSPAGVAPPPSATGTGEPAQPARGGRGAGRGVNAQNAAAKQIWVRPLWDGTYAVGLFNLDTNSQRISISPKDLSAGLKLSQPLQGPIPVRDLWQLKDLDKATDAITTQVPRHGCAILKVGTPKPEAECIADLVKMHAPK